METIEILVERFHTNLTQHYRSIGNQITEEFQGKAEGLLLSTFCLGNLKFVIQVFELKIERIE